MPWSENDLVGFAVISRPKHLPQAQSEPVKSCTEIWWASHGSFCQPRTGVRTEFLQGKVANDTFNLLLTAFKTLTQCNQINDDEQTEIWPLDPSHPEAVGSCVQGW